MKYDRFHDRFLRFSTRLLSLHGRMTGLRTVIDHVLLNLAVLGTTRNKAKKVSAFRVNNGQYSVKHWVNQGVLAGFMRFQAYSGVRSRVLLGF